MTEGAVSNSNCNVLRLGKAQIKASDLVPVQYVQGGVVPHGECTYLQIE